MAECKRCVSEKVCRYNDGHNLYCKEDYECPHFKNKDDVAEVKHGEWIESQWRRKGMDVDYCGNPAPQYFCSLCQRDAYSYEPYCHCGAKMDGKEGAVD